MNGKPIAQWPQQRNQHRWRIHQETPGLNQCSCGLLCCDGTAQDGPIDIRPEVFAAHSAAGSALDGRASFGRNGTDTVTPLADEYRRNGEVSGKTRSAPWCR